LEEKIENKNVGLLIIGIAVVMAVVVLIFNNSLSDMIGATCSHGPECTMYSGVHTQTGISLAIVGVILIIGLVIMFSKPQERIVVKRIKEKIHEKRKPIDYSKLDKEEKIVMKIIEENEGTIFQSDLVDNSGFGKVKVSRILDKLEGRQIIERKRRGMTNVVVLKN